MRTYYYMCVLVLAHVCSLSYCVHVLAVSPAASAEQKGELKDRLINFGHERQDRQEAEERHFPPFFPLSVSFFFFLIVFVRCTNWQLIVVVR